MGVDLGIRKIAMGYWHDRHLEESQSFESTEHLRQNQLGDLADWLGGWVFQLNPDSVWIENTLIGNNRKYSIQLSQTMGAVLSAVSAYRLKNPPSVFTPNVQEWKKGVIGSGHATKEDIRNYLNTNHRPYSALCGDDQDRYDAACIGYYGQIIEARVTDFRSISRESGAGDS